MFNKLLCDAVLTMTSHDDFVSSSSLSSTMLDLHLWLHSLRLLSDKFKYLTLLHDTGAVGAVAGDAMVIPLFCKGTTLRSSISFRVTSSSSSYLHITARAFNDGLFNMQLSRLTVTWLLLHFWLVLKKGLAEYLAVASRSVFSSSSSVASVKELRWR